MIDRKLSPNTPEPPPTINNYPHIADLVIEDIKTRKQQGVEKYKTALQPFNGRNALIDAYQEAMDLCQYLRQAIEEQKMREDGNL